MAFDWKSKLPRLASGHYRGNVTVFWTHTLEHRARGWLSPCFHARFREILLHSCHRFRLLCPVYVLMPDHWHLLFSGWAGSSDQLQATAFLRRELRDALAPAKLQDRAHDHVLRERE